MTTNAATINVINGKLVGASGVLVAGDLYNVDFKEGTCNALFGGCDSPDDFVFDTQTLAGDAYRQLMNQVFIGDWDRYPDMTYGIENLLFGAILTPWTKWVNSNSEIRTVTAHNGDGINPSDGIGAYSIANNIDTVNFDYLVFAVWQPTQTVPEPATMLLFGLGLLGLAGVRRKLKR